MAVALRSVGGWGFAINSFTPLIPTAQAVDDMMIFVAAAKPFDSAWSVPAGWTSLGSAASGNTASGVDSGSVNMEAWYKIATTDPETNPQLTEGAPGWNIAGAVIYVFSKGASEVWETPVAVYGADEVSGTSLAFTYASDPGGVGGDYVMLSAGINTDAMGPLTSALAPTWTGITFGTADTAVDAESILSDDMAWHAVSYPVSSGTSSAAPTSAGTGTASGGADMAESVFVRLHTSPPGTPRIVQGARWMNA